MCPGGASDQSVGVPFHESAVAIRAIRAPRPHAAAAALPLSSAVGRFFQISTLALAPAQCSCFTLGKIDLFLCDLLLSFLTPNPFERGQITLTGRWLVFRAS